MTTIRYFIPEDGDEELQPNVFLAPKSRHPGAPPTLGQIRDAFPLPGRYYFRFKSPLVPGADREKGAMSVWMDCTQENVPVPTWRNSIVAKVTRVSVEDDDDEDDSDFVSGGAHHAAPAPPPRPAPAPAPQQQAAAANNHHFDVFGDSAGGGSTASKSQSNSAPSTGNLLDAMHSAPPPSVAASSSGGGGGGLLDMDAPVYGGHAASSGGNNAHSDFLGMTASATPAMPQQGAGGYSQSFGGMPQQQQQAQQQQQRPPQQNAFNSFSNQQGPFGGLGTPWK